MKNMLSGYCEKHEFRSALPLDRHIAFWLYVNQ
jgi:hypothetical protein